MCTNGPLVTYMARSLQSMSTEIHLVYLYVIFVKISNKEQLFVWKRVAARSPVFIVRFEPL